MMIGMLTGIAWALSLHATLCVEPTWAEKQSLDGMEIGDATCLQVKRYRCEDDVELAIAKRFRHRMTCDHMVHSTRDSAPCCMFTAHNCKETLACLDGPAALSDDQ